MKKKPKTNTDVAGLMVQIQEQLAVMNEKLDQFMTKSLTELAQALAAARPVVVKQPAVPQGPVRPSQHEYPPKRPMYAVVCYECGKDTELPFKPSGNRPVYCPACFALRKGRTAPVNAQPSASTPVSLSSAPPDVPVSAPAGKGKKKTAPAKPAKARRAPAKKPAAKKKPAVKKKAARKK